MEFEKSYCENEELLTTNTDDETNEKKTKFIKNKMNIQTNLSVTELRRIVTTVLLISAIFSLYFLLGEFAYIKYQQMAGMNPDVLEYRGETGFLAREYLTEEVPATPATAAPAESITTSGTTSSTGTGATNTTTLKDASNVSTEIIPEGIRLVQVEETQSQVEIALKYNFFHYDKPQKADYLFVYSQVLPAIVHLYDEDLKTNGSGFIMEITKDSIYVVTNFHVAQYMINDCRVYFSQNIWADAEFQGSDDFFDLAVYKVPVNKLPEDEVLTLKEITYDPHAIDNLEKDNDLLMVVEYYNSANYANSGDFIKEIADIPDLPQPYSLTTLISKPGASGSPIFDYYGDLVGMNYGRYWQTGATDYINICVPLKYVIESYEQITGRKLD